MKLWRNREMDILLVGAVTVLLVVVLYRVGCV